MTQSSWLLTRRVSIGPLARRLSMRSSWRMRTRWSVQATTGVSLRVAVAVMSQPAWEALAAIVLELGSADSAVAEGGGDVSESAPWEASLSGVGCAAAVVARASVAVVIAAQVSEWRTRWVSR